MQTLGSSRWIRTGDSTVYAPAPIRCSRVKQPNIAARFQIRRSSQAVRFSRLMPTPFASPRMIAALFQAGATRVGQPNFTAVAASRVDPVVATAVVAQPVKSKEVG